MPAPGTWRRRTANGPLHVIYVKTGIRAAGGRRGEARAHDGTIVWKMPEARAAAYCSIASVPVA